ncbi:MAG: fasciclin domain-containing protein [Planctomycetota bacterium]
MNTLTTSMFAAAALGLSLFTAAPSDGCDGCGATKLQVSKPTSQNIVETAMADDRFETLVAAVKAAGLVDTLSGEGPFTVFAPTDDAFAALPEGTLEKLLEPENRALLTGILTYHVVPGRLAAADVVKRSGAVTVNGQQLDFSVTEPKKEGDPTIVRADGARIVATDLRCSNGVIHVIDAVVMPADENIVETAKGAGTFGTLLAAAKAAGLAETLAEGGPFTVFAPTDDAFAALPDGTVESLLRPENRERLATILKHHVVAGRVYSSQVVADGFVTTLAGTKLRAAVDDDGATIGGARLARVDLDASNGVVHVVDSVLLP